MTERIGALTVILEEPVRTDDVKTIIAAIMMIRGVAKVETHPFGGSEWMAKETARRELEKLIWDAFYGPEGILK